jgi:hypothetical protein
MDKPLTAEAMILFEITGRISAKRIYLIGFTVKIKTSAS